MKTLRSYDSLGKADFGWLKARYSFSFANYFDRNWMGFGPLRVINNDRIAGGGGFAPHDHDNMEIITYVIDGRLAHGDSIGNKSVIEAGNIQLMSAGAGITHSEYNADAEKPVHLLQIWLKPNVRDEAPSYQERRLAEVKTRNELVPLVTPDGRDGTLRIKQDATLSLGRFDAGATLTLPKTDAQDIWVQVVQGEGRAGDTPLAEGDGLALRYEEEVSITFSKPTELLVFFMSKPA